MDTSAVDGEVDVHAEGVARDAGTCADADLEAARYVHVAVVFEVHSHRALFLYATPKMIPLNDPRLSDI